MLLYSLLFIRRTRAGRIAACIDVADVPDAPDPGDPPAVVPPPVVEEPPRVSGSPIVPTPTGPRHPAYPPSAAPMRRNAAAADVDESSRRATIPPLLDISRRDAPLVLLAFNTHLYEVMRTFPSRMRETSSRDYGMEGGRVHLRDGNQERESTLWGARWLHAASSPAVALRTEQVKCLTRDRAIHE